MANISYMQPISTRALASYNNKGLSLSYTVIDVSNSTYQDRTTYFIVYEKNALVSNMIERLHFFIILSLFDIPVIS